MTKTTLKLFNTLSRTKEEIQPLDGNTIRMYTCGPTVYDFPHVGNMRAFVLEDLLKRTLLYFGYSVQHLMNITDVGHLVSDEDDGEDKMEKGARREHKSVWEVARMYTNAFYDDLKTLNIKLPDALDPLPQTLEVTREEDQHFARATDHIAEQIALVNALTEKGYTYAADDGIYFDTSKLSDYGKLAKLDIEGLEAGKRVEVVSGKKNPTDFALWKFSPVDEERQMEWVFDGPRSGALIDNSSIINLQSSIPAAWKGNLAQGESLTEEEKKTRGFPGWHIECSAMAMKYLGESFDIHCGGVDHIPVHHTNEIVQSEAATGKPFSKYWMHVDFLQIEGKKMSKSLGNFYTVPGLTQKGFSPRAIRFLYLSSHYRQQQNFTLQALEQSQNTLSSIDQFVKSLGEVAGSRLQVAGGVETTPFEKGSTDRTVGGFERNDNGQTSPLIANRLSLTASQFDSGLSDDLNIPQAITSVFDLMREVNPALQNGTLSSSDAEAVLQWLRKINEVLGVFTFEFNDEIPSEVQALVDQRKLARENKDFAGSDTLRDRIEALGYMVKDTKDGQKVEKK